MLYSLKRWAASPDRVLADLARRFTDRDLFRTVVLSEPPHGDAVSAWREACAAWLVRSGLSSPAEAPRDAALYVSTGTQRMAAYSSHKDPVCILERDGTVRELSEAADTPSALVGRAEKAFVCLPKEVAAAVGL